MKLKIKFICLMLAIFSIFNFSIISASANSADELFLGGMPAGFSIGTKGAHIVGLCDVITENGLISPSKDAGILVGDVIISIDGTDVNNVYDVERALKTDGEKILNIKRNSETIIKSIKPAKDLGKNNKLGVFIKDDVNGIGTITYIKGNRFASLGHPVVGDDNEILSISGGTLFDCNITGCIAGEKGKAGELRGVFIKSNALGTIDKNLSNGVYGDIYNITNINELTKIKTGQAKIGNATIFTTIDGKTPHEYSISIIKCSYENKNKNFVIKITDKKLLTTTGGIVQGMSGSPIVQNGKLVGAVTHVFINDPTRGFGISIENMINN